jgi:hypothetical protein
MHTRSMLALGVVVICCCGCGPRVLDERDVSLELGDIQSIMIGPFKNELTVTVSASSPGAPISVYVFASDQQEHVDYAITYSKEPHDTWAGVASTEDATLTAVVPADTEAVVRLQTIGRNPAQVHLKISN